MSGVGPWLLASISPVMAMLGVVVGSRMTSRREMAKLALEQGERLRMRRQEAYAEFYSIVFGIATAALADYEPGVIKDASAGDFHDSLRLRATIGLLGPETILRQAETVLAALSALDQAANDPMEHEDVPSIAHEVRRQADVLLEAMREIITDGAAPAVAALPSRGRGLRRAGRAAMDAGHVANATGRARRQRRRALIS